MANEIKIACSLAVNKGANVTGSGDKQITMSGTAMHANVQPIGTSAELLTFGDISGVPAQLFLKNLDATNFVEFATDSGMSNKFGKLLAGECMLWRPSSASIYAKADTAAVNLWLVAAGA
jgi:hypothetical protein